VTTEAKDPLANQSQESPVHESAEAPVVESIVASARQGSTANQPRLSSAVVMVQAGRSVLAVVDDDGYMVPLFTAADLLRGCRAIWKATQP
jgi:CBS-domain-containing membrane protein